LAPATDHEERRIDANALPDAAAQLADNGMALATVVATDELSSPDRDLKVRYVFEPAVAPAADRFVTLVVSVDPERAEVPSLTLRMPAANWHEREAQDLFGIVAVGHPDPRPLVLHDGWPHGVYPLRKSFDGNQSVPREPAEELPHMVVEGEGVFEIPVGPIHAGIIEPGHFRFSSVGEMVLHLDARLFYTHRGLEKRIEGMSVADGFHVAERLCGVCSVAHGLGFCAAVESIAGIEAPPRARAVRAIALELERLYNHVGDIGNLCAGASYHWGTSAGLRIKETLQRMNERLAGNRFLRGWLWPGGVQRDLDADEARALTATLGKAEAALADLDHDIGRNPTVADRFDETGLLPRQAAVDLGVTGVAARASGVDRDARRDHPHGAFALLTDAHPQVVTAEEGDVNARYRVRTGEARESMRLIRHLLERLPAGPLVAALPEAPPAGRVGLVSIESPRGASIHWLRLDALGRVDRYHVRSASYANWPAVPIAALSAIVPDFPLVNKSFELCYACTDR
jgi:Ni,Fe-hydrogenase III large subunit/Ni,Fe-hydrogenase III component G